eukprot:CAMPEP_0184659984 /NCGR_PEP_ID=MMETSP0308-20130426/31978_1 /TAXON_ID=38269 /ORGANISM="Gloeochaete witrockiana, Strain SAG 46.84" /LENGTH=205 /DNA_ID=CAMNT_0027100247 /DNA_START=36 /DNA_END=650 /DNA_ORIENTATION=-
MAEFNEPLGLKLEGNSTRIVQQIIKDKLMELIPSYSDDVLPEYIVVMIANNKTGTQVCADLDAFLGGEMALQFTKWLWEVMLSPKVKSLLAEKEAPPPPQPTAPAPKLPPPTQMVAAQMNPEPMNVDTTKPVSKPPPQYKDLVNNIPPGRALGAGGYDLIVEDEEEEGQLEARGVKGQPPQPRSPPRSRDNRHPRSPDRGRGRDW